MRNKLFLTMGLLISALALSLASFANAQSGGGGISTTPVGRIGTKVVLPCKVTNKDVGSRLDVTNSTKTTLAVNRLIYFSTNTPDSGSFKTSNQVAPGQGTSFYAKPQSATSCQAWIFQ